MLRVPHFVIVVCFYCLKKKCFPMATVAIGDVSIAALLWKNVLERRNISVQNFLKS